MSAEHARQIQNYLAMSYSPRELLVLVTVAVHGGDACQVRMSVPRLGRLCGMKPPTIHDVVIRLEKRGDIDVIREDGKITGFRISDLVRQRLGDAIRHADAEMEELRQGAAMCKCGREQD